MRATYVNELFSFPFGFAGEPLSNVCNYITFTKTVLENVLISTNIKRKANTFA